MQGGRGGRGGRRGRSPFSDFGDPFNAFGGFGGFGGHRSLLSSFFGGRDPFDDPFFTRPFGGIFESSIFGPTGSPFPDAHAAGFIEHQLPQPNKSRGPIIEELNSDDEREGEEEKKENPRKHGRSNKSRGLIIEELNSDDEREGKEEKNENLRKHGRSDKGPYVEDPDDEVEERKSKQRLYSTDFNGVNTSQSQPQTHSFTFQSSTVTYGGANGVNYTSSRVSRTGNDGLKIEESKEADTARGKATHRISRGIHDKGHSVTRNLNPDGRVNTMQTLHNLNEDELTGFEEAWKGNARKHLPGWTEGFNVHDSLGSGSGENGVARRGGWALPSSEHTRHSGSMEPEIGDVAGGSRSQHFGRMKTGSNRGRYNMDRVRRR